jgi:hypothetical protein
VRESKINKNDTKKIKESIKYFSMETGASLFISFLINSAVIATFAKWHNDPEY